MRFLRIDLAKRSKGGNWAARLILVMFIVFSIWLTLSLISEGNYYSATGLGIISTVFIFFLALSFVKPNKAVTPISHSMLCDSVGSPKDDQFAFLYSSKDIVRITQVEQALRSRGIDCMVLDTHGSVLMSFIPDIQIRIMVPQKDFEWSVQILNELFE